MRIGIMKLKIAINIHFMYFFKCILLLSDIIHGIKALVIFVRRKYLLYKYNDRNTSFY